MNTTARKCRCGRILLPTRDGRWPRHYYSVRGGERKWCPHSDLPIPGRTRP